MNEIEYRAMKNTLQNIIDLMKESWEPFKLGSVPLEYYVFFQELEIILGLDESEFHRKGEEDGDR